MNKTQLKEDIFTYSDVLTEEECKGLIGYFEDMADMWGDVAFYESYGMGLINNDEILKKHGLPAGFIDSLKNKMKEVAEDAFQRELSNVSCHAQKWAEGGYAGFHSDNSDNDGNPSAFEKSKYAVFLYLNGDIEGGILNFKDHPIQIKPERGLAGAFAGGHVNLHEVQVVKKGTRYTVGSFWDNADAVYDEATMKKWEDEIQEVRRQQEIQRQEWAEGRGHAPGYTGK